MLAECGACGTRFAPDLERCPHCGSQGRAGEMPKITADGPSYAEGHAPGDGEEHVHPSVVAAGAEAGEPDAGGEPEPAVIPEPSAVPVVPPRRVPPPAASGE